MMLKVYTEGIPQDIEKLTPAEIEIAIEEELRKIHEGLTWEEADYN